MSPPMVKVFYTHTPPNMKDAPPPSLCLQCPNCKGLTWVFTTQEWTKCARCGIRLTNDAGTWKAGPASEDNV